MASIRAYVPLAEEFIEPNWDRYTTAAPFTTALGMGRQSTPPTFPYSLATLNHIDVRTFNVGGPLDHAEHWTSSQTVQLGPNSNYNNWRMLSFTAGNNPIDMVSISDPLDLTAIGDPSTVYLQAALISSSPFTLTSSYIALSSDGGNTWAQQTLATALSGNTVRVALSNFASIDLTAVNGVRLHFVLHSGATVAMSGLRVIDLNYSPSNIMFDTWNKVLRQDIPFDANVAKYPPPISQQMPAIYYAASTGGSDDPQPIDATMNVLFNTGGNTGVNQFSINMRQVGGTNTSQLLLEDQSMLQLSGPQPNLTETAEIPRRMSDFQGRSMSYLEGQSMLDLDATAEHITATYLTFNVVWGNNQIVTIADSLKIRPYLWTLPALQANTVYLASCSLEENAVRLQIYTVNQSTLAQGGILFDSGSISDSYQFPRRPGRIGWAASFSDGEAYLLSIRPEHTLFAEYQSAPLNSRTPVEGAQIYTTYSPDIELWSGFSAATSAPSGAVLSPTVTADTNRTITGSSTKVFIGQVGANQGIVSNVLSQDDFSGVTEWGETTIRFSVWVPSSAALSNSTSLGAYLVSDSGWYVPLTIPTISFDTWQEITLDGPEIPSGLYQLQILYLGSQQPTTFWVDQVSVTQRVLSWSARANPTDPWVFFNGLVNDPSTGVCLNRGTQLQVRAQALRQDAAILAKPKVKPRFAQLGKPTWPEDVAQFSDPFLASLNSTFTFTHTGRTYSFVGAQVSPSIGQWIWQFSDGAVYTGPTVTHNFSSLAPSNRIYQVTLTLVDIYGGRSSTTDTISVM